MEGFKFTLEEGKKIWFTSDIHYWHKNITYGESVWDDKGKSCRMFDSTREMSLHMVNQINKYVKEDDILFHLGDWSFSGIENIFNLRKQLNVKTIHHINGNHDQHIINNKLIKDYFINSNSNRIIYKEDVDIFDYYYFYHYKPLHTKDLFTSINDYLEIKIGKELIILSHYPFQSWRDIGKDSIHLHGHTHGNINSIKNRLDVGLDSAFKMFGEYKPFSFDNIIEILK